MPKPVVFLLVVAVGAGAYLLGSKNGKDAYEEVSGTAKKFWNDPAVKKARKKTYKRAEKAAKKAAKRFA